MLHPSYVKTCTDFLSVYEQVAAVSSRVLVTEIPNQIWPDWQSNDELPFVVYPKATAGPCPVWRRSLHDTYGYFDDRCEVVGDAIMWEKWVAGGEKFGLIDQKLTLYYKNALSLERRKDGDGVSLIQKDLQRLGRS
jgi:hypothetical protein